MPALHLRCIFYERYVFYFDNNRILKFLGVSANLLLRRCVTYWILQKSYTLHILSPRQGNRATLQDLKREHDRALRYWKKLCDIYFGRRDSGKFIRKLVKCRVRSWHVNTCDKLHDIISLVLRGKYISSDSWITCRSFP